MVDFLNLSIENTEYAQDLCLERIVEEISRTFFFWNLTLLSDSLAGFANEIKVYRVFFSFLEKQFLWQ